MIVSLEDHLYIDLECNIKLDDTHVVTQALFVQQFVGTITRKHCTEDWNAKSECFLTVKDTMMADSYSLENSASIVEAYNILARTLACSDRKVNVNMCFYKGPLHLEYKRTVAYQFYELINQSEICRSIDYVRLVSIDSEGIVSGIVIRIPTRKSTLGLDMIDEYDIE